MKMLLIAAETLDILLDMLLKATHQDKSKDEIEALISRIKSDVIPAPCQTQ